MTHHAECPCEMTLMGYEEIAHSVSLMFSKVSCAYYITRLWYFSSGIFFPPTWRMKNMDSEAEANT